MSDVNVEIDSLKRIREMLGKWQICLNQGYSNSMSKLKEIEQKVDEIIRKTKRKLNQLNRKIEDDKRTAAEMQEKSDRIQREIDEGKRPQEGLPYNGLILDEISRMEKQRQQLEEELRLLAHKRKDYGNEVAWFSELFSKVASSSLGGSDDNEQMQMDLSKLIGDLDNYMGTSFAFDGGGHINGNSYANGSNDFGDSELELSSSGSNISDRIFRRNDSLDKVLKGVEHRPIEFAAEERTEQQIISSISGDDNTKGSCSSLALAYAGNRAGYVVYDFRDGQSRDVFSTRRSIEQIANLDGVNSVILRGVDDTLCAEQLMTRMEIGREYYMATGEHAAIVRQNNEGYYQYLELQSDIPSDNGWQPLTLNALSVRFGCEDRQATECSNYLIELDSLQSNTEFLNLLGYINTDESAQARGASRHE